MPMIIIRKRKPRTITIAEPRSFAKGCWVVGRFIRGSIQDKERHGLNNQRNVSKGNMPHPEMVAKVSLIITKEDSFDCLVPVNKVYEETKSCASNDQTAKGRHR
jgi:hypothetical protein